jgi:DHA3 family macrolide efflux protein-like MFS transporter
MMFLRTLMLPMVRGTVMAIFQSYVPADMQGRVFTLLLSSMTIMAPFGLALGGPLAEAYGVPIIFVITGFGCLGVALIWVLTPKILYLEDDRPKAGAPKVQTTADG